MTRARALWPALAAAIVLWPASGCDNSDGALDVVTARIEVAERVLFAPVFFGRSGAHALRIENVGRAPAELVLQSDSSVFVVEAPAAFTLAAGQAAEHPIRFIPDATGPAEGELTIAGAFENAPLRVRLNGRGEPPPACDDGNDCTVDVLDEQMGVCTFTPRTGPCDAGACITGAQCQDGACVGAPVTCSPSAGCFSASCDAVLGCMDIPIAGACDDDDACTDDVCSASGCVHPAADDGASCGAGEVCVSADVCVAGACASVPVPDGVLCESDLPCALGVCIDSSCVSTSVVTTPRVVDELPMSAGRVLLVADDRMLLVQDQSVRPASWPANAGPMRQTLLGLVYDNSAWRNAFVRHDVPAGEVFIVDADTVAVVLDDHPTLAVLLLDSLWSDGDAATLSVRDLGVDADVYSVAAVNGAGAFLSGPQPQLYRWADDTLVDVGVASSPFFDVLSQPGSEVFAHVNYEAAPGPLGSYVAADGSASATFEVASNARSVRLGPHGVTVVSFVSETRGGEVVSIARQRDWAGANTGGVMGVGLTFFTDDFLLSEGMNVPFGVHRVQNLWLPSVAADFEGDAPPRDNRFETSMGPWALFRAPSVGVEERLLYRAELPADTGSSTVVTRSELRFSSLIGYDAGAARGWVRSGLVSPAVGANDLFNRTGPPHLRPSSELYEGWGDSIDAFVVQDAGAALWLLGPRSTYGQLTKPASIAELDSGGGLVETHSLEWRIEEALPNATAISAGNGYTHSFPNAPIAAMTDVFRAAVVPEGLVVDLAAWTAQASDLQSVERKVVTSSLIAETADLTTLRAGIRMDGERGVYVVSDGATWEIGTIGTTIPQDTHLTPPVSISVGAAVDSASPNILLGDLVAPNAHGAGFAWFRPSSVAGTFWYGTHSPTSNIGVGPAQWSDPGGGHPVLLHYGGDTIVLGVGEEVVFLSRVLTADDFRYYETARVDAHFPVTRLTVSDDKQFTFVTPAGVGTIDTSCTEEEP